MTTVSKNFIQLNLILCIKVSNKNKICFRGIFQIMNIPVGFFSYHLVNGTYLEINICTCAIQICEETADKYYYYWTIIPFPTEQFSFLCTALIGPPEMIVSSSGSMEIMNINCCHETQRSSQQKAKKETELKKKHHPINFCNSSVKLGELSCSFTGIWRGVRHLALCVECRNILMCYEIGKFPSFVPCCTCDSPDQNSQSTSGKDR